LNFTPKYQFSHIEDKLAAFIDNELRGISTRNINNGLFYLFIGGEAIDTQKVTLKLYSGAMEKILIIDSAFYYQSYAIKGDDENPYIIEFSPIVPLVSEAQVSNGIYSMPIHIMDTSFIGSITFTFIAKDPVYPQYLFDETNATFCIVSDSSDLTMYYQDVDGDGLGNPNVTIYSCSLPTGYVTNDEDCNDNDASNENASIITTESSGIANDGMICSSSNVTLSVQQNALSYIWSNGATTQSIFINPSETAVYSVTVTYNTGCIITISDTVFVEGKIVKNSANSGFHTLRNILECAIDADTITYDFPMTTNTNLTSELSILKNVTIKGLINAKPKINIDFNSALYGIMIYAEKKLTFHNVDLKTINGSNDIIFVGPGKVDITGSTNISSE
jgi:hypothetical protein